MQEPIVALRKAIEQEVFTCKGQTRIIPETADWLMDFRRVCLDPDFLDAYTEVFYERFHKELPFQVGGMEVAAIPLVSAIVMKMREKGCPVNGFFVRKSRKKDGLLKMVEGKLTDDPVILVDDLINRGYTFDRQLKVMEEAGKTVKTLFTLLRFRAVDAYEKYTARNIRLDSLFSLDDFSGSLGTHLLKNVPASVPKESFRAEWYFKSRDPKLERVAPKSAPAIDDARVYFGGDQGIFWALNQSDGSVAWQYRVGVKAKGPEIFSSPVICDGRIYFSAYDSNTYCLDAMTGKRIWVSFDADWVHGSPLVIAERHLLIVPSLAGFWGKRNGVVALDMRTGKKVWQSEMYTSLLGTPIVDTAARDIFVPSDDGTVYCIERESGKTRWTFATGGTINEACAYDEKHGVVIAASFDGGVYALDATSGLLRWRYDTGIANYASPCIYDDRVYVTSLGKSVHGLDIRSGEWLWEFSARARIFSSPRVYGGKLYFGGNDARFYELDLATGKQTGFFQTVERITDAVAYNPDTKRFFLRTYADELYCLVSSES
jgi:outer membrane protein assembly factor BamB/orotate phosphoribosyltransferase